MALEDKTLVCRDCGQEFIFTAGEQEFFSTHGLQSEPTRCRQCRALRRRERAGETRQMYPAVCASCGAECEVPFEPRSGRPVYCDECFSKQRTRM